MAEGSGTYICPSCKNEIPFMIDIEIDPNGNLYSSRAKEALPAENHLPSCKALKHLS